jgi:hypothetical protein
LNDTIATLKLFEKLIKKISKMSKSHKEILYFILSKTKDKNILWFKNFLFEFFDEDL